MVLSNYINSLVFLRQMTWKQSIQALKRVGRIDKTIKMDYITKSILEILTHYYNTKSLQKYNKKITSIVKSNTCYAKILYNVFESETIDDFFKRMNN